MLIITLHYTCCHDEIKATQDLKICSDADSLDDPLSLAFQFVSAHCGLNRYDLFMMEEEMDLFQTTIGWYDEREWNFNKGWIMACWGKAAVEGIADKITMCSGTTMGTTGGVSR